MRNLTIKRNKSFVGCFAKIKIYIEDAESAELTINNTPCRKIGELKNGEVKTFEIGEQALKVFAIADAASRNICFDCFELSEGTVDVFLSGKNLFNPATGNAFIFDNNNNEKAIAERKKAKRKGTLIIIASLIVGVIIGLIRGGVFDKGPQPKQFTYGEMSITLTDDFIESEYEKNDFMYESRNIAVFGLREDFNAAEGFGDNTLEQYANIVLQNNEHTSHKITSLDNCVYYYYDFEVPDAKDTFRYFTFMYKSDKAFWLIQFAVSVDNVDSYEPQIMQWAKSVEFSK